MIDPVARNVIPYYPQANTVTNAVTNVNNYINTGAQSFDQDQIDGRIDHNITDTQRIFGRFSWRDNVNAPPAFFPGDLTIAEGRVIQGVRQPSASIDYSNTLSRPPSGRPASASPGPSSTSTTRASALSPPASASPPPSTASSTARCSPASAPPASSTSAAATTASAPSTPSRCSPTSR
jgi:hypothetical protein